MCACKRSYNLFKLANFVLFSIQVRRRPFNRKFHDIETGPPAPPMTLVPIHFSLSLPLLATSFSRARQFCFLFSLVSLSLFSFRRRSRILTRSWPIRVARPGPAGSPSSGLLSFWREPPRRFSFYRFPPSLPFPSPGPSPTSFP